MTSQDALALLKRMRQRGEITDAQYDVLRRHVLCGTPLPDLVEKAPPGGPEPLRSPAGYVPGQATVGPDQYLDRTVGYVPGPATVGPDRHPDPGGPRQGSGAPEPTPDELDPGDQRHGTRPSEPTRPDPYAVDPGLPRSPVDPGRPAAPGGQRHASRRERREAEEAAGGHPPSGYLPPVPPPTGPSRSRHRRDDPPGEAEDPPAALRDQALDRTVETPQRHRRAPEPEPRSRRPADRPDRREPGPDARSRRPESRPGRPEPTSQPPGRRSNRLAGVEADGEPVRRRAPAAEGKERVPAAGARVRRPRRRSVVAVLTSLALALALAAGGVYWFVFRTEGLPPATYAREACGRVSDWQQAVDSSNAALLDQISREEDKSKVRTAVTTYYATIARRTDQLRAGILELPPAALPGGREYADSLAAAVGDQATALRGLATRAGRLDPAASTFKTDLSVLLTGADTAVSAVTTALARPSAGITTELRSTLSDDPACAPYVG